MTASQLWTIASLIHYVAVAGIFIYILRKPWQPRTMLAWILAMLLLPVLGILLFLLLGEPRRSRHRKRRRRRRRKLLTGRAGRRRITDVLQDGRRIEEQTQYARSIHLASRVGALPATDGNLVTLYFDADKTFLAIRYALETAQSHIHMEYYIFQPDETGRLIRDLLIRKAQEGVECRLLLDYMGCWHMPRSFWQPMDAAGVHVKFAMPMIPWRGRWLVNFRNHRKILVVDGRTGFTGSQNIGNEYLGKYANMPPWRDTHLRVEGPGAGDLQYVFIEDWHYSTREDLLDKKYLPAVEPAGDHIFQILATGPTDRIRPMHQLLFAAMAAAQRTIRIITPYFVPDELIVIALQSAALRGVRVQLIIPTATDHPVVLWAGRSYYPQLIQAGVEIYEHDGSMLHSKVAVIDDEWGTVGSANMDERSFRINFEVTTLLYSSSLARELVRDFDSLRERSRRIHARELKDVGFVTSLKLGLARLASPIL